MTSAESSTSTSTSTFTETSTPTSTDLIPAPRTVDGPYRTPFVFATGTALAAAPGTEGVARWLRTVVGTALGRDLPPARPEPTTPSRC